MAIKTDRPGGGDDRVLVFKARNPDEARKARAALVAAGIEPEFPENAIDPYFQGAEGRILPVRVALKDAAKGIKAIDTAFPRGEDPSAKKTGEELKKDAEVALAPTEVAQETYEPLPADKDPAPAVERAAKKALYIAISSLLLPGIGFVLAFLGVAYGMAVKKEIQSRPDEKIGGEGSATLAIVLGILIGVLQLGGAMAFLIHQRMQHDY